MKYRSAIASLIGILAPRRATQYLQSSHLLEMAKRSYAAAGGSGSRQLWAPSNTSAKEEIRSGAAGVRARARDLVRNNSWASGSVETLTANLIGEGIIPQGTPQQEKAWQSWSHQGVDVTGRLSIGEAQRLMCKTTVTDGEIFIRRIRDKNRKIPLAIELLEPEYLDSSVMSFRNREVADGIESDKAGKIVAYHFIKNESQSLRVSADDVIHIFRIDRPGQNRGISWLAPIIPLINDLAEYRDYEMIAAKLAASFGVFISSPDMGVSLGTAPSDTDLDDDEQYIQPGKIVKLRSGENISFAKHERPGTTFEPFIAGGLRESAVGFGLSYESFSGDYSRATYSSARAGTLDERRKHRIRQQLFKQATGTLWTWCMEAAIMAGMRVTITPPIDYQVKNHWTWIDPLKDACGAEIELMNHVMTRREWCASHGRDWDTVLDQLKTESEQLKKLGETNNGTTDKGGINPPA